MISQSSNNSFVLSLTKLVINFRPQGHQEPCNEGEFLRLAKHPVGFEPATLQ